MEETPNQKPRVVIIGAGFGGLEAAKKLSCEAVSVTVVDRTPPPKVVSLSGKYNGLGASLTWQRPPGTDLVRVEVTRADAYMTLEYDITAPRQKVWEYFTVPGQWQSWWPADTIIEHSNKGRRGVGTKNHCMHGKDAIIEEMLDWRPFDYFTVSTLLPIPGAPKIVMTPRL